MEKGIRVLVIDDDIQYLDLTSNWLTMEPGLSVEVSQSSLDALSLLREQRFDAVICDYQMPEMDGIEVLKAVRSEGSKVPFIIFTGRGRESVVMEALNNGADSYIQKGGEPRSLYLELRHRVIAAVERHRAQERLDRNDAVLRKLSSQVPGVIFELKRRPDGFYHFSFASEGVREVFGCEPGELSNGVTPILRMIVAEDCHKVVDSIRSSAEYLVPWQCEFCVQVPGRAMKTLLGQALPERTEDDEVIWHGFITDISERRRMDEKLRESEERYRSIVDNANDIIYSLTVEGVFTYVSRNWSEQLGHSVEGTLGKRFSEYVHPDDALACNEFMLQTLELGTKQGEIEYRLRHGDGDWRWYSSNLSPMLDRNGEPISLMGIARDITDRKNAEDSIMETNEILSKQTKTMTILNSIIVTANEAMDLRQLLMDVLDETTNLLEFDAGGVYITNPEKGMAEIIRSKGLSKEFLAQNGRVSIHDPPYSEVFINGNPIFSEDYSEICSGPDRFGVLSIASVPLMYRDKVIGALNVGSAKRYSFSFDDKLTLISIGRELGNAIQRLFIESSLKDAANELQLLFDSITEMFFVVDPQWRILRVNQAAQEALGYSEEELRNVDLISLHAPEQRDEVRSALEGTIFKAIDSCPVPILTREGKRIEVETKVSPGWMNGSEAMIVVSRDVSERKRMENALRQANKQLNILSSITRHDAMNQIMVIDGYSKLLKKTDLSMKQEEYVRKIHHSADTVQSQLLFAKSYQDIGVLAPTWQVLSETVGKAAGSLNLGELSVCAKDLDYSILADPMFEKVVYNLIENCLRHSGGAKQMAISASERDGDLVMVFEDDGNGISVEDKAHLFERGYGKNTGFGLFLSREVLAITSIRIVENSEPGRGARFEITIPSGEWRPVEDASSDSKSPVLA